MSNLEQRITEAEASRDRTFKQPSLLVRFTEISSNDATNEVWFQDAMPDIEASVEVIDHLMAVAEQRVEDARELLIECATGGTMDQLRRVANLVEKLESRQERLVRVRSAWMQGEANAPGEPKVTVTP